MAHPRVSGLRLEAFVQQAREPLFVLNPERRIVLVNKAWEDLTGRRADEVVGMECRHQESIRPGDLEGLADAFHPPPEVVEGRAAGSSTLIVKADGERLWRRVEYWPFHDDRGNLTGLIGLVRPSDAEPHAPDSEAHRVRVELIELRDRLRSRHGFDSLIGRGPEHRRLLDQVTAASRSTVPLLIVGEAGTGKRLVARTIHQQGPRRQAPFLAFDSKSLPPEILDRQLFGTSRDRDGRNLAVAEGSTLLIGDLPDLPRDIQARLARSLDEEVQLIGTTAGDPDLALKSEKLRPDLYYAMTTLVLRLRPLRDRLEELPVLAQHLLERTNLKGDHRREGFSPAAMDALVSYDWPGNFPELARVIDHAHGQGSADLVQVEEIPASIRGERGGAHLPPRRDVGPTPLKEMLTRIERDLIEKALAQSGDNKSRAAKLLGINRPFLYRRLKELGISDEADSTDGGGCDPTGPGLD